MERLYVVTRKNLTTGLQIAQSVHAAIAFSHAFPEKEQEWFSTSNNLACLACDNEESLREYLEKAREQGFRVAEFHEPDLGDSLTAFAVEGSAKKLLRKLPLAPHVTAEA